MSRASYKWKDEQAKAKKLREIPDSDPTDYREDEDSDEVRCSLKKIMHIYVPPEGLTIPCPIHGKHRLDGSGIRHANLMDDVSHES